MFTKLYKHRHPNCSHEYCRGINPNHLEIQRGGTQLDVDISRGNVAYNGLRSEEFSKRDNFKDSGGQFVIS